MSTNLTYPDYFIAWAKEKLRVDGEYILVLAQHGSVMGRSLSQMIIEAAREVNSKKEGES